MKADVFLLCLSLRNNPNSGKRHFLSVAVLWRRVIGRQGSWWPQDLAMMICHPQAILAVTYISGSRDGMYAGSPGLFFYYVHEWCRQTLWLSVHKSGIMTCHFLMRHPKWWGRYNVLLSYKHNTKVAIMSNFVMIQNAQHYILLHFHLLSGGHVPAMLLTVWWLKVITLKLLAIVSV